MEFKHLLITRLNVFYKTKMAEKGFNPEVWLNERVDLFKRICFPSVLNQSKKNFAWFFYIDSETPSWVRADLEALFVPFPFIQMISHQFENFSIAKYLQTDVDRLLGSEFQYLISCRVDTDDMLHRNFIETVQSFFGEQEYKVLNFSKGYVYDISSGVSSLTSRKANPFISLFEKRQNGRFQTVFCKPHTDFLGDPDYLEIGIRKPLWCMTVHGLNDSTGFYGRIIKFVQPDLKGQFGFEFQKQPNLNSIIKYTIRSYQRTLIRVKSKLKRLN